LPFPVSSWAGARESCQWTGLPGMEPAGLPTAPLARPPRFPPMVGDRLPRTNTPAQEASGVSSLGSRFPPCFGAGDRTHPRERLERHGGAQAAPAMPARAPPPRPRLLDPLRPRPVRRVAARRAARAHACGRVRVRCARVTLAPSAAPRGRRADVAGGRISPRSGVVRRRGGSKPRTSHRTPSRLPPAARAPFSCRGVQGSAS